MADIWFYTRGGKQMEPVSTAELRQLAGQGLLKPTDMVWREGMPQWIRASAAKGIFDDPNLNPHPYGTSADRPLAPSRPQPAARSGVYGSGRQSQTSAARYAPRRGMKTGTKVGIILGVSLLLGGLAVAAVLLKINSSSDPDTNRDKISGKDPDKPKEPSKDHKKDLLETFKINVPAFGEEKRSILLRGGVKYEFNVAAEKKPNLYLDDPKDKEVAKLMEDQGTHVLTYTPSSGGQFQVSLTNPWGQDLNVTVAVHGYEAFPFEVGSHSLIIRGWAKSEKNIDLEAGIRYEIKVTNDKGSTMDLYLVDMAGGIDVASSVGKHPCFITWVCGRTGKYKVEVSNQAPGDITSKVLVQGMGKAPFVDVAKPAPPPAFPDPPFPGKDFPVIKDFKDFPKDLPKFDGFPLPPKVIDIPPPKFEVPKGVGGKLPPGKLIAATRVGTVVKDDLNFGDSRDPSRPGCVCKVFQVDLVPEKEYTIDMMAAPAFDAFLRLVNAAGEEIARDDDGGDGLNSRIRIRPKAAGTYRIVCTTYSDGASGAFTLIVREE